MNQPIESKTTKHGNEWCDKMNEANKRYGTFNVGQSQMGKLEAEAISAPLERTDMIVLITEQYIRAMQENDEEEALSAFIRMKHIAIHKSGEMFYYEELGNAG